ncbi:probable U3 small nucleolar RNA-associated protein 11 [Hypomesus transpacificus]|uniref:probable U3 small nucleolar RNA-associated protein 11 n=1 Tax=Hypomesus transpacificus TaxID=137520 RepID=UPI001F075C20|nr:probable U3 small nucleolar RNA-associated protein 11 [Hypomesus transpacificus]
MSSFRKALKSQQRNHKERSQPGFRKHLGFLEKKKDYKLRADDYHKKQNTLAVLRKKALDRNPDEFYYKMVSSQLQEGVHVANKPRGEEEVTEEQLKVMRTRDARYVEMKRVAEIQKIERLKSELHVLDAEGKQRNQHTFFMDSEKEVQEFDLARHLDTAPELVGRVFNRPTLLTLETKTVQGAVEPGSVKRLARQRRHQYHLLSQRVDREKKMFVIAQKIQTRKDLQDKTSRVKVQKETQNTPAVYKFETRRKR